MKNPLTDRYVATVMAPDPSLGGVVEAYRGWQPCIDWCIEQFGLNRTWHYVGEGVFEFQKPADRTFFILKWG